MSAERGVTGSITGADAQSDDQAQVGFIAQEMQNIVPELVNGVEGSMTLNYGNLGAVVVKSIQQLNLKLEDLASTTPETAEGSFTSRFFSSLFTRLTQWFADATNGITKFFAKEGYFSDKLCVGETCVTEEQFNSVFGNEPTAAGAPSARLPQEAPSGQSAPEEPDSAGTPSASTVLESIATSSATSSAHSQPSVAPTPPQISAANDNQPAAGDANAAQAASSEPTDTEAQEDDPNKEPEETAPSADQGPPPQPANDNSVPSNAVPI